MTWKARLKGDIFHTMNSSSSRYLMGRYQRFETRTQALRSALIHSILDVRRATCEDSNLNTELSSNFRVRRNRTFPGGGTGTPAFLRFPAYPSADYCANSTLPRSLQHWQGSIEMRRKCLCEEGWELVRSTPAGCWTLAAKYLRAPGIMRSSELWHHDRRSRGGAN